MVCAELRLCLVKWAGSDRTLSIELFCRVVAAQDLPGRDLSDRRYSSIESAGRPEAPL